MDKGCPVDVNLDEGCGVDVRGHVIRAWYHITGLDPFVTLADTSACQTCKGLAGRFTGYQDAAGYPRPSKMLRDM